MLIKASPEAVGQVLMYSQGKQNLACHDMPFYKNSDVLMMNLNSIYNRLQIKLYAKYI